jgi:hypothetical protein
MLTMLLAFVVAVPAWAGVAEDTELAILRDTIRANKKALVAASLTLTDAESEKFWAVYDRYEKDMKAVNDRLVALVDDYTKNFKTLSNEHAEKLVQEYLSVEEARNKVRRDYLADFGGALPGKKVARFYQIENKIEAVVRYDLAGEIPVVED